MVAVNEVHMPKPPKGFMCLPVTISPPPQTPVPCWTGGTFTHRRRTLEFGSAVGEVVGGRLMAHWFQLMRERKS